MHNNNVHQVQSYFTNVIQDNAHSAQKDKIYDEKSHKKISTNLFVLIIFALANYCHFCFLIVI